MEMKKTAAVGQVFILVVSILAFSYIIGNEFGVVSAGIVFDSGGSCENGYTYTFNKVSYKVFFDSNLKTPLVEANPRENYDSSTSSAMIDMYKFQCTDYIANQGSSPQTQSTQDQGTPATTNTVTGSSSTTSYFYNYLQNTALNAALGAGTNAVKNAVTGGSDDAAEGSLRLPCTYPFSDASYKGAMTLAESGITLNIENLQETDAQKKSATYQSSDGKTWVKTAGSQFVEDPNMQNYLTGKYNQALSSSQCNPTTPQPQTQPSQEVAQKKSWFDKFYGSFLGKTVVWTVATQGLLFGVEALLRTSGEGVSWNVEAAHKAVGAGVVAGNSAFWLAGKLGADAGLATGIGLGVGILAVPFLYDLFAGTEREVVQFNCYAWQAETGGKNCEICNKQENIPCTEYQCRSLGQGCELINKGTDEQKCAWLTRDDVNPPQIEPDNSALPDEDFAYTPNNQISPPDRGVFIEYKGGNIPAFTSLSFGINVVGGGTDSNGNNVPELATCKADINRKESFDEMKYTLSNGVAKYNHSYSLSLPSLESLESSGIVLQNGGEFNIYVRCQDVNGNSNVGNFVFSFIVDDGPDTTPPLIEGNSFFETRAPVSYEQESVNMQIYVNEPAECRWSHRDESYDKMAEQLDCSDSEILKNLKEVYTCDATLTGIKDRMDNDFYFRCQDKSENLNVNKESYQLTLVGTQPLVISSAEPNDTTLKDSSNPIKVTLKAETSAGYEDGQSICYFSESGNTNTYTMFYYSGEQGGYVHNQELWLQGSEEGVDYDYFIKCVDAGGNTDIEQINFSLQTDNSAPLVTRAYHEDNYLKLVTNEVAQCVYDIVDCSYNFEDGAKMTNVGDINHFTEWDTSKTYYVKCKDKYENQPEPNACSIIARPSEL